MATDDGPDAGSAAERHLLELLAILAAEPVPVALPARTARMLRRARLQRDIRPALVIGAGLAASVFDGLVPLVPRRAPGARP
jgi:hypothetical protein